MREPADGVAGQSSLVGEARGRSAERLWRLGLGALTLASVVQLWWSPLLPMQDAPQHIMITEATATFDDPTRNWGEVYERNGGLRPYALGHAVMGLLFPLVGAVGAAKGLVTLYLLLHCSLALPFFQTKNEAGPPWLLLLLPSLAFSPLFYMGFLTFLLSCPLCLWALWIQMNGGPWRGAPRVAQSGLILLLWFGHPVVLVTGLCLSALLWMRLPKPQRPAAARWPLPWCAACLAFGLWFVASAPVDARIDGFGGAFVVRWASLLQTATFAALPVGGMWPGAQPDGVVLAAHSVLLAAVVVALVRCLRAGHLSRALHLPSAWLFGASTVALLALPHYLGHYAYFGVRMLYFASVFGLMSVGLTIPLRRYEAAVVSGACIAILFAALVRNHNVSRESAEVLPLLQHMRPNARVLPVVNDGRSAWLHPTLLPQAHAHDADYYHAMVGGGANPTLFPNPMLAIRYRQDRLLPRPTPSAPPASLAAHYDYILWRDTPDRLTTLTPPVPGELARNGQWLLLAFP